MSDDSRRLDIWRLAKCLALLAVIAVVCVKIYVTPIGITVDFPTLLSLLLAVFSVGLAALFYFKATETSNTFYDNTYKFTRDIAQLLAKIESGFGERLRHLDEGYSALRDSFHGGDGKGATGGVEDTKQRLEEEKQEIRKVSEDRERIVRRVLAQSHLEQAEKKKIAQQLKDKEEELAKAQQEVTRLNQRLMRERMHRQSHPEEVRDDNEGMNHFTRQHVVRQLGARFVSGSPLEEVRHAFMRLLEGLPPSYVRDLSVRGYVDGPLLTERGLDYLRRVAREGPA